LDEFEDVPMTMSGGEDETLDDFGPAVAPVAAPTGAALEDDEIPF